MKIDRYYDVQCEYCGKHLSTDFDRGLCKSSHAAKLLAHSVGFHTKKGKNICPCCISEYNNINKKESEKTEEGTIYSLDFIREEIKKLIKRVGDYLERIEIRCTIYESNDSPIWRVVPILVCTNILAESGGFLSIRIGDGYEFISSGEGYDFDEKLELVISECRKVYFALRKEFPILHRDLHPKLFIDYVKYQADCFNKESTNE